LILLNFGSHLQFGNFTLDVTDHPTKLLSPSETDAIESRMMMRSVRLAEHCSLHGLDLPGKWCNEMEINKQTFQIKIFSTANDSLHKPNSWEFLINKKHHLVWCNVFKAASTSWMYNFNILAGYSPQFLKKSQTVPLTLARKRYPRPSVSEVRLKQNLREFH
jgi:chondroitin 4-sulfotransferase 11